MGVQNRMLLLLFQLLLFQLSLANTITISVGEDEVPRSFSKEFSATNIEERRDEKQPAKISKEEGTELPCPPSQFPFPGDICLDFDDAYNSTNAASLGFHHGVPGVDGLDLGIATLGINISL